MERAAHDFKLGSVRSRAQPIGHCRRTATQIESQGPRGVQKTSIVLYNIKYLNWQIYISKKKKMSCVRRHRWLMSEERNEVWPFWWECWVRSWPIGYGDPTKSSQPERSSYTNQRHTKHLRLRELLDNEVRHWYGSYSGSVVWTKLRFPLKPFSLYSRCLYKSREWVHDYQRDEGPTFTLSSRSGGIPLKREPSFECMYEEELRMPICWITQIYVGQKTTRSDDSYATELIPYYYYYFFLNSYYVFPSPGVKCWLSFYEYCPGKGHVLRLLPERKKRRSSTTGSSCPPIFSIYT